MAKPRKRRRRKELLVSLLCRDFVMKPKLTRSRSTTTGLEDFGFAVQKKNDDDDESVPYGDDLGEDDVVDDLSDGEGDEEAGEVARMAAEAREEKVR